MPITMLAQTCFRIASITVVLLAQHPSTTSLLCDKQQCKLHASTELEIPCWILLNRKITCADQNLELGFGFDYT